MCKNIGITMNKKIALVVMLLLIFKITGCAMSKDTANHYKPDDEVVVLAHGLGRSGWAMWKFAQRLEDANYKVCRLDYATLGESVNDVLTETSKQIDACIINVANVHFVGHSLGGLVIRAYLQESKLIHEEVNVGKVVLIGTPNKGSELADHFKDSWLMDIGGGISRALVTGNDSLGNSLGNNLGEVGYDVGIIAGTKSSSLTREKFIGPNDGLVSVESAKLINMNDFITIDVGHSQMRYNLDVSEQTIHYLQNGTFKH
jgi:triacylglycerol esterase/lipase EstA (alpha/beta hydrolase family)